MKPSNKIAFYFFTKAVRLPGICPKWNGYCFSKAVKLYKTQLVVIPQPRAPKQTCRPLHPTAFRIEALCTTWYGTFASLALSTRSVCVVAPNGSPTTGNQRKYSNNILFISGLVSYLLPRNTMSVVRDASMKPSACCSTNSRSAKITSLS